VGKAGAAGVTPEYWDDACRHLARRDRVMKKLIPQFGEAREPRRAVAKTNMSRCIEPQPV
jgi:DNA-3-methyladenine glycosylase II